MSYYPREEQETLYAYDPVSNTWAVHSTYPPHIKSILARVETITLAHEDEDGTVIAVEGYADKEQIRLYKK
ncbi:hypothetical protein [Halobacillus naozhouensis]|uniref:YlzJ-like protein n=1 Tax=Halobacillus naozhouensis TaxID=554880 RepID=A0ABY8IXV4_9BACI|nr:hypothetical protein [Halobacillus naozhouensis]WFT74890.1 hypothetical protein P9989_00170 [Halobacillus naozhouensis]